MNHRERCPWESGYIARDSAARLRKSSCKSARLSSMPVFTGLEIVLVMISLSYWGSLFVAWERYLAIDVPRRGKRRENASEVPPGRRKMEVPPTTWRNLVFFTSSNK